MFCFLGFGFGQEEYTTKFGLINKLVRFITWEDKNLKYGIDTYATEVFNAPLEAAIKKGTKIKGHLINGKTIADINKVANSTILFVPNNAKGKLKEILSLTKDSPTLVISEQKNGAQMGAIINLILENNKLIFQINKTEAKRKKITINSKVLKIARKVY